MAIREANPFPSVCGRVCNHPCEEKCRAGNSGGDPIAIRSLKRFVTDNVDPSIYKPVITEWTEGEAPKVAIIGCRTGGIDFSPLPVIKGLQSDCFRG